MCWHMEDLNDSVNQYFLDWSVHYVTESCISKDSFKVQVKPMNFGVSQNKKIIDMVLDFTWQQSIKKWPLNKFWCCIEEYI